VYTRASLTDILARKIARVGQVGEDPRASRTRRHPRDDPRAEVGEDVPVGVGVSVRVGAVECQLYRTDAHDKSPSRYTLRRQNRGGSILSVCPRYKRKTA